MDPFLSTGFICCCLWGRWNAAKMMLPFDELGGRNRTWYIHQYLLEQLNSCIIFWGLLSCGLPSAQWLRQGNTVTLQWDAQEREFTVLQHGALNSRGMAWRKSQGLRRDLSPRGICACKTCTPTTRLSGHLIFHENLAGKRQKKTEILQLKFHEWSSKLKGR